MQLSKSCLAGTSSAGDADLEKLPPGWRLETCMLRTAQGVSVADTSFVCPTSGSRFPTLQQALEHVKSRRWRPLVAMKADFTPVSHTPETNLKRAVTKSAAQTPPTVPLPAASLGCELHPDPTRPYKFTVQVLQGGVCRCLSVKEMTDSAFSNGAEGISAVQDDTRDIRETTDNDRQEAGGGHSPGSSKHAWQFELCAGVEGCPKSPCRYVANIIPW